ncbi:hypothetical protein PaG_05784 [Moesziomyces aphidis]|uniref:Paf1-domain-containing protein n=1 Tax=Moesziomyces aphidis TaxID=84754 RepID=W3VHJ0_MOEAP|nr:hypothetical protein PaG_05784 [Moesziomyces aphidis]
MSYSNGGANMQGAGAAAGSGVASASAASTSRSRRELIDRVKYPNPIPLPPYPPKLVKIPAEPSRYANAHFADRLASQQPVPLIVDVHAGMPIDLANFQNLWEGDLSEVSVPATASLNAQDLDDADAFLLQDFATNLPAAATTNSAPGAIGLITSLNATDDPASQAALAAALQQRHTQSLGPGAKAALAADDVSWLRRTEYLGTHLKAQQQVQKPKVTQRIDISREAQLAKIEQSFKDAQQPLASLKHPHKRGVKAVQVFDFLPDPETWATNYQVVRFIDPPGRIVNGVPQPDPRLDVAILRPVSAADGEQRVSYYLPAGEDIPEDPEEPMTLLDNPDKEENNARRLRKRRRTGKFPIPPQDEDQAESSPKLLKRDYATAYKLARDYVPKDTAETAHDVLVLTLDDGVPDADPDANFDPIKGAVSAPANPADEDDDDLFGDDDDEDTSPKGDNAGDHIDSTLPPQSESERQKRSRRTAATKGKERSEQPAGDGLTSTAPPKARAYYHKVGMRFTLRVWRSRFANNEKLRNRDRRYPGKWDAILLANRELTEREKLRRLHARSNVDDVGHLDPYEPSDDEIEEVVEPADEHAADADAASQEAERDEPRADANGDADADADADGAASDNDAEKSDGADDDDDEDDDDDDEDGTVDGDEELAALRAEAEDAGEDLDVDDGARRPRSRRSAPSTDAAAAMEEDDD